MKEDFPGIVDEMWLRERNGYTVAFLKEHDSDGPGRPFLAILLEGATLTRPATPTHASLLNIWIIPALLESEGVLFKVVGWAARLAGYPDRLVVPFPTPIAGGPIARLADHISSLPTPKCSKPWKAPPFLSCCAAHPWAFGLKPSPRTNIPRRPDPTRY